MIRVHGKLQSLHLLRKTELDNPYECWIQSQCSLKKTELDHPDAWSDIVATLTEDMIIG